MIKSCAVLRLTPQNLKAHCLWKKCFSNDSRVPRPGMGILEIQHLKTSKGHVISTEKGITDVQSTTPGSVLDVDLIEWCESSIWSFLVKAL